MNALKFFWENRGFKILLTRNFISALGSSFSKTAKIALLLQLWSNEIAPAVWYSLGTLLICIMCPFTGNLIDRFDYAKVIVVCDILSCICLLGLAFAAKLHSLVLFFVLTVSITIDYSISYPAAEAFLPKIIPQNKIALANTITETMTSILWILGIGIGGLFTAYIGIIASFLSDAGSYVISAILMLTFIIFKKLYVWQETINLYDKNKTTLTALGEGFKYLISTENRRILVFILVKAIVSISSGSIYIIHIGLAPKMFQWVENGTISSNIPLPLGICYSISAFGGAIGPIVANIVVGESIKKITKYLPVGILSISLGIIIIGICPFIIEHRYVVETVWIIGSFFYDAGIYICHVFVKSALQKLTKKEIRGRVFTIGYTLRVFAAMISSITTGVIVRYLDLLGIVVSIAALTIINISTIAFYIFYTNRYISNSATMYIVVPDVIEETDVIEDMDVSSE